MLDGLARRILHEDEIEQDSSNFVDNVVSANKLDDQLHIANCNELEPSKSNDLESILKAIQFDEYLSYDEKCKIVYDTVKPTFRLGGEYNE